MKTVACDVCGKTYEQLSREHLAMIEIHRYTKTKNNFWWQSQAIIEDEFDICDLCLHEIKQTIKRGGVSNETD